MRELFEYSKKQVTSRVTSTQKKERSELLKNALIIWTPPLLVIGIKFLIEPNWLHDWSYLQVLTMGVVIGIFAGVSAKILNNND